MSMRTRIGRLRARRRERRWRTLPPGAVVDTDGYRIRVNDGLNFTVLHKDLFGRRLYAFDPATETPEIVDGGANIGMATLFWKRASPNARIRAFEPDPTVYPYLQENVERNGLEGVELERSAIGAAAGTATFHADSAYSSYLAGYAAPGGNDPATGSVVEVPVVRLRDLLDRPVDLLKLNIEGAETDALLDAGDTLRAARELLVEYHHLPGAPRSLHRLLERFHDSGFEYLVNSFDDETNSGAQPPFRLGPDSRYYLLLYARRLG
jgi:FkbM family methyltransferase